MRSGAYRYPNWTGRSVIVLASGHSVTLGQFEAARVASFDGCMVVAINSMIYKAAFAQLHWFCDERWFEKHWRAGAFARFCGRLATFDHNARLAKLVPDLLLVKNYGWQATAADGRDNYPLPPTCAGIYNGRNSGFQAISLAWLFGARDFMLCGFDGPNPGGRDHCHEDHPWGPIGPEAFAAWNESLGLLAAAVADHGGRLVQCSPGSRYESLPFEMDLHRALAERRAAA